MLKRILLTSFFSSDSWPSGFYLPIAEWGGEGKTPQQQGRQPGHREFPKWEAQGSEEEHLAENCSFSKDLWKHSRSRTRTPWFHLAIIIRRFLSNWEYSRAAPMNTFCLWTDLLLHSHNEPISLINFQVILTPNRTKGVWATYDPIPSQRWTLTKEEC